jgi:septal ring factor EnvC (AmiA/AmiB activator)
MWKKLLVFGFVCCLSLVVPAVLPAEEQYRITEYQLQSIEQSITELENNRRNWESQAHNLNRNLGLSEKRAETLNNQLREERNRYSELQLSFNKYEASQLKLQAEKDREIADLRVSNKGVKGRLTSAVIVASFLGLAWIGYIAFRVCRFLKIIPV